MTQSNSKSWAKGSIIALLIKGTGAVLAYVMIVVFARLLGPEEYGRFATGLSASIVLAALAGVGFPVAILRFFPQYQSQGAMAEAKGVAHLGYKVVLLASIIVAAICVVGGYLAQAWGWKADMGLIWVLAALVVITTIGEFAGSLVRAQGNVVVSMLPRDVLWRILAPLSSFLVIKLGFGQSGALALFVSALVLLVLNLWQVWTTHIQMPNSGATESPKNFTSIRPALIAIWLSSVAWALIQQFDVVIVGSLLSKPDAGAYFASQKTAQLLGLVLIAGGMVTAPIMASLHHAKKFEELQALCRKLAMAIAAVTALGLVFVFFVGKFLLGLFDPAFVAAYPVLMIIAVGAMVDALSGPNAFLMQMTRFEGAYLKIMLAAYAVVVAAQIILIPRYGIIGAALASACGVICWNAAAIFILRRKAGLDPSILSVFFPPRQKVMS